MFLLTTSRKVPKIHLDISPHMGAKSSDGSYNIDAGLQYEQSSKDGSLPEGWSGFAFVSVQHGSDTDQKFFGRPTADNRLNPTNGTGTMSVDVLYGGFGDINATVGGFPSISDSKGEEPSLYPSPALKGRAYPPDMIMKRIICITQGGIHYDGSYMHNAQFRDCRLRKWLLKQAFTPDRA